jgi:hypothetical protein
MQPMPDAGPLARPADAARDLLTLTRALPGLERAAPKLLPVPTWATPTREARARALLAAYRAEYRDAGQRILLREMLAHFRAACVRAGHADPLARPALPGLAAAG